MLICMKAALHVLWHWRFCNRMMAMMALLYYIVYITSTRVTISGEYIEGFSSKKYTYSYNILWCSSNLYPTTDNTTTCV